MQRKVICTGEMSSNPFSTLERQNFPEFSPVFTKNKTPSSSERNGSFHWSIDHIARLKPADIDTDPATLVKTNGHSPENDNETQKVVDTFFSQRTILPSPWTTGTKTAVKRVTFSPLPPAMAFIREDPSSLVESDLKGAKTADCGTQTVLTFPFAYDLEKLLSGTNFCFTEDDNVRDISNSSLRRKLFGQPDRQGSSTDGDAAMDVGVLSPRLFPVPDATATQKTPLSKKGHYPSSSSTPLLHPSHYHSPAIIHSHPTATGRWQYGDRGGDNPAMSSMVLPTVCEDLPEFSPIGGGERESSPNVDERDRRRVCSKSLFPVTPCKNAEGKERQEEDGMSVSPILSPIRGLGSSPRLTKPGPMAMEGVQPMSTGKTTSTPNTAVMKRQLAVSPFASPVLKQPCTMRTDMEDCNSNSDSCETEDLAQPLSLNDLKTETYDFTNITATTCTGYFTQIGLEESRHPLHSTATNSRWQAPIHSTMVDVQRQLGAASLPTVQGVSQIPSSTWAADSGVAASAEFNATSAQSLTSSSNELGITKSSSNPFMLQASKEEELQTQPKPNKSSETAASQTQNGTQDYKSREKRPNSWMLSTAHPKSKHPDLPTIQEGQTQTDIPAKNRGMENNIPCESDSGLVASPDEMYSRQTADSHRSSTSVPTSAYAPTGGSLTSASPHPTGLKLQAFPHTTRLHYDSTAYGGSIPTSPILQCTPSRYNTAYPLKSGLVPHQMKFPTVFPNSILPSRPKLSTTPIPSLPSTLPQPENSVYSFGIGGGDSLSSVYHTPPSRYSGLRGRGSSLGDRTSFAGFTREVLRKKASLKSRLQFSSPIRSTSPFSSPASSPLHMPMSGATQAYLPVTRPRTPLTEVALNGPKTLMNCCSPFSHSSGHKTTVMAFKIS